MTTSHRVTQVPTVRRGDLAIIESASRTYYVKPTPVERFPRSIVRYVSAETVDVHGILAEATRHTYAGSDMPRPYDSLAEIKALCRAYRR